MAGVGQIKIRPGQPDQPDQVAVAIQAAVDVARHAEANSGRSRELSLAITKLEEAQMWAQRRPHEAGDAAA